MDRLDSTTTLRTTVAALVVALALGPALAGAHVGTVGAGPGDGVATGPDEPPLADADARVAPDGTTETTLTLSTVPEGLSGFNVTVAVADTGTATITDAALAEPFPAIGDGSVVVAADGGSVRLKSADLDDEVGAGDGPVTLGTVTLAGETAGTADLVLSVEQVDDDEGSRVDPAVDDGLLTVGDGTTATPTATPTPAPTTDQPSTPTETVAPGTTPPPTTTTGDDGTVELGVGGAGGLLTVAALALALVVGSRRN
jgi:hypothetical protein